MLPASRPQPDELVYSALVRCSRLFNLPQGKIARIVFDEPHWRPSFLGASNLETLGQLFRLPAEQILWEHSVFPYVTAALSKDAFERALANALLPDGKRGGLGGVIKIAAAGVASRRFCPLCAKEEVQALGYSYWHRSHNLPGVWICLKHGGRLHKTQIELSPKGSRDNRMPHECQADGHHAYGDSGPAIVRFAEISVGLLSRARTAGDLPSSEMYRRMASEMGLAAEGKRIDTELLLQRIRSLFSDRFLEDANVPLVRRRGAWPFLMLRPGVTIDFLPAKHAAMQAFLESATSATADAPSLAFRPAGANPSPAEMLDSFYSQAASRELQRLKRSRLILTTEQFLRRVGCFSHYRRRRRDLPKLAAVVREFRSSQASVKPIAAGRKLFRDD